MKAFKGWAQWFKVIDTGAEINRRIQIGGKNWRKLIGIICKKKKGTKLKGSCTWTVVLYGMENYAFDQSIRRKNEYCGNKNVTIQQGVTRRDRIRNEEIRKFWSGTTVKEIQGSTIAVVWPQTKKERRARRK